MVCNVRATASAIKALDEKIRATHQRIAKAPDPTIYAPQVSELEVEVEQHLREAIAHGGDHDTDWIESGMPGDGPEHDAWQTSQDITAGWTRRKDAIAELRKRVTPKPKRPDGDTTTPEEAIHVTVVISGSDEESTE
jgi:hypothetical protein